MVDAINSLIGTVMASPWALLAIFMVCVIDAFFPVVPSETTVIAGGALAASGGQNILWVIVLAAVGAVIGDHISYSIGRGLGTRAVGRVLRGEKGGAALRWAEGALESRGGLMIVALRFIPGGRTATTLAAGTLRYPLLRFSAFDVVAALMWALYGGFIGYFAGDLFQGNHLLAVTVGVGLSAGISLVVEVTRHFVRRRGSGEGPRTGGDSNSRTSTRGTSSSSRSSGSSESAASSQSSSSGPSVSSDSPDTPTPR